MIMFFHELLNNTIFVGLGGILIGIFIGAGGNYWANKCTDQRRNQEENRNLKNCFKRCQQEMPELFNEMIQDLSNNKFKSEFVLLEIDSVYGGFPDGPLSYYMNKYNPKEDYKDNKKNVMVHSYLLDKIKILEMNGFVIDITPDKVKTYRMTDNFLKLLRSIK